MKVLYDPDKDILQISFKPSMIEETAQIAPGLILDYDEDGSVVGFELRSASQMIDDPYQVVHVVDKANTDKPPLKGDSYL